MKTEKELKEMLIDALTDTPSQSRYSDYYRTISIIRDQISQAWSTYYSDEVLSTYYEGDEKPEEPTNEFIIEWIENEPLDEFLNQDE